MHYRHAYHAGNFADVFKHVLLVALLRALGGKDKPWCCLDTHAGAGRYRLDDGEIERNGEWREGIARLLGEGSCFATTGRGDPERPARDGRAGVGSKPPTPRQGGQAREPYEARRFATTGRADMPRLAGEAGSAAGPGRAGAGAGYQHRAMESRDELDMAARDPLIGDYLDLVRAANPDGGLRNYPGSPWLAVRLARADDRVVACEAVPEVAAALAAAVPAAERHRRDGYEAHALLPPKERRGLVLVDPPFERADEFEALAAFVNRARARFAGGVYAIWYPLKNRHAAARFVRRAAAGGRALELRLDVGAGAPGRLHACAVLVINPPFGFTEQAEAALRALLPVLRRGAGAGFAVRPVAAA